MRSRYARSVPDVAMNNAQEMVEAFKNYLSDDRIQASASAVLEHDVYAMTGFYTDFELDSMRIAIKNFDWDSPELEGMWDLLYDEMSPETILDYHGSTEMPRSLTISDIADKYGGEHKGDTSLGTREDSNTGETVSGEDHEIAMPKMVGDEGFQTIREMLEELEHAGAQINDSTGLHVHISKEDLTPEQVANVTRAWGKYEWAIDQLYREWRRGNKGYSRSIYEKGPDVLNSYSQRLDPAIRHKLQEAMEFIDSQGSLDEAIASISYYEKKIFNRHNFDDFVNRMTKLASDSEPNTPEHRRSLRNYMSGAVGVMTEETLRETFSLSRDITKADAPLIAKQMVDEYVTTGKIDMVIKHSGSLPPFDESKFLDFVAGADDFMDEVPPGENANVHRFNVLKNQGVYSMSNRMLREIFSFRDTNMTFGEMQMTAESMLRKYLLEDDLHGAAILSGAVEYDVMRKLREFAETADPNLDRAERFSILFDKIHAMENTEISDLFNQSERLTRVELLGRVETMLSHILQGRWSVAEIYVDTGFKLDDRMVFKYQSYEDAVDMLRQANKARSELYIPWEKWLDRHLVNLVEKPSHYTADGSDGSISQLTGRNKINVRGTGSGNITIEFRGHDGTLDADRIETYVRFLRNFVERFKDEHVKPSGRIGNAEDALQEIMPGQPASMWHVVGEDPLEYFESFPKNVQNMIDIIKKNTDEPTNPDEIKRIVQMYESTQYMADELFGIIEQDELLELANRAVDAIKKEPQDPKVIQERVQQLNVTLERGEPTGLIGKLVESPQEFAALAQFLRHPSRENTWIVYMKDGKIIEHEAMTLNASSETIAPNPIMLEERVDLFKADNFVLIHNHPGGVAEFSEADLEIALRYDAILGSKFGGMQVINSGTYGKAMREANGDLGYPQNNLQLPSELVGWDTDSPIRRGGWKGEQRTRQADPLYQTIIEDAEMNELWEDVLHESTGETGQIDSDLLEKNILLFGQRLKVKKNWIVAGFMGESGRLDGIAEYQGLQNLTPPELYHFLRKRADAFGGSQVMIHIGEGDWYSTTEEAMRPFTDLLEAQYPASFPFRAEPEVTPGGIAAVTVAHDNKVLLPNEQEGWSGTETGKNMVEELFRSFGDESETGLQPLKRYDDRYDRKLLDDNQGAGKLKSLANTNAKSHFEQAINNGKVTIGRQNKTQSELERNQLPRHRAEHRTEKRKTYRQIREEGALHPSGEGWDDGGTQISRLDYIAGDSRHVYFTYGDGGNDGILTYGGYGFIFDPEVLINKYNAQVGPDISSEYNKIARKTYDDILKKHGISTEEYVDGRVNNQPFEIDNELSNRLSEMHEYDNPNPVVTEIIETTKQRISELQSEKRVQGEAASEHLSNQELWEGMHRGRPEFLVEGQVDLNEGVIGIIENFKIKMLTEDSIGKPPIEWKYKRGQVEWNDVFEEDNNLKSPLALEHMTKNKDRYNQIRKSGKLTGGHPDFIDSDAQNLIFFSVGASWRSAGGYGFVFDPKVLIKKYDATPSQSNVEDAINNGFDTGFTIDDFYDYIDSQVPTMRKSEEDAWEFTRRTTHAYLKEKGVDIYGLMLASGTADEMQIKGPIDLKDAVGVVEDNVLKTITYTSRDGDPIDWKFTIPNESSLVKSELDVFMDSSKNAGSYFIKESPTDSYIPPTEKSMADTLFQVLDNEKPDKPVIQNRTDEYQKTFSGWVDTGRKDVSIFHNALRNIPDHELQQKLVAYLGKVSDWFITAKDRAVIKKIIEVDPLSTDAKVIPLWDDILESDTLKKWMDEVSDKPDVKKPAAKSGGNKLPELNWNDAEVMLREGQLDVIHTYYDDSVESAYPQASHMVVDTKNQNRPVAVVLKDNKKELKYYRKMADAENVHYDVYQNTKSQIGEYSTDFIKDVLKKSGFVSMTQNIHLQPDIDAITTDLVDSLLPKKLPDNLDKNELLSNLWGTMTRRELVERLTTIAHQKAIEISNIKNSKVTNLQ